MEHMEIGDLQIRGTEIYYLIVCARKLWLFQKGIQMEHTSDRVKEGTVLHETAYKRQQNKEVAIDNLIQIDILDGETVREVKSSSKMYNADKMQILYYLYYLKREYDIEKIGKLHYPKEKKTESVVLTKEAEYEIESLINQVIQIKNTRKAPRLEKKPICKKCAYFQFCFSGEEE